MHSFDWRRNVVREAVGAVKAGMPSPIRKALRSLVKRNAVRRIRSESELNLMMSEAEARFSISEDAGRSYLASVELTPEMTFPSDPYSPEYREAQMRLYRTISGRSAYTVQNECSAIDLKAARFRPYPYATQSPEIVGDQLIAQGFLVKALPISPPARLVEFGPGWGHTTSHLLQLGYAVTAVEVDEAFAELIRHRTREYAQQLTIAECDMLEFATDETFDVAIFFESFHHCSDHVRMIDKLCRMVSPQGAIVFGSEPICDLPYPWGVRLDGMSLWSMRRHGWLELGFEEDYFFSLLRKKGWEPQRTRSHSLSSLADVIVARRM